MIVSASDESDRRAKLAEISRSLLARLDLEGVLEGALAAARELTGASYAALAVRAADGSGLERFLTLGVDATVPESIGELPSGRGVLEVLSQATGPLRIDDVTAHPSFSGLPAGHPSLRAFLGVPIRPAGEPWGILFVAAGEERPAFDADDEALIAELAEWAAVAIGNARLYEGVARRRDRVELKRDEAERTTRALAVMSDIARSVGGETDVDRILELIVGRGRALVDARLLLILLAEGDELVVAACAGEPGEPLRGRRLPIEGTAPGRALRTGEPQRPGGDADWGGLGGALAVVAGAAIVMPLTFRGKASGVLVAVERLVDGPAFGVEDERLLRSFSASAATAVATARSVEAESLRRSLEAAEAERKRWARELHDGTLQALGALRMMHQAALRDDADPDEVRRALSDGVELIESEIDGLTGLIAELRPASLDEIGLVAALGALAERKEREGGIEIKLRAALDDGTDRLPAEIESAIYRLVQESLNNVVKHARASRAEVSLWREEGWVGMRVRDDGPGFDPARARRGYGLIGMTERAQLAGGELSLDAGPGRGTTVTATLPERGGERR